MEIQTTISQGMQIVAIRGRLDTRTTPAFVNAAAEFPAIPLIIDLAGLEYLSSAGLRALLQLKRDKAKNGTPVVIAGTTGLVDKVIRVSGFDQVFVLYPTAPAALQGMAEGSA